MTTAIHEPTPLERGDVLSEDRDIDPENPDAEVAAAALTSKIESEKAETEKAKDTRIPAARHKEILEKEREKRAELERQLAQYQKGGQIADVNAEITAAEDAVAKMDLEHQALLSDGHLEEAAALMAKIRKTERDMAEAKSDMKIQAAEMRATERVRYNTTLERIENAFPTLNPDHDEYDADVMAEVVELKEAYQLRGHTPTAALQKAVKALVEPRTSKQEIATNVQARVADKDVAAERRAEAVEKTSKASAKTPPSLARAGADSDKMGGSLDAKTVINMSQKEFAKLTDEQLSRMRGDTL